MSDGFREKRDEIFEEENSNEDELNIALEKVQQYLSVAQRLQADFDNFRKRTERENEEFRKYATEGLIKDLLTIIDDLDRALETVEEETLFVKGVKGIRSNLMKTLKFNGLTEISTDGMFDSDVHEALCVVESDTDGDIAEVLQKGYRINDKVIRYSKVKVTKKKNKKR